jgi:hypothetical protein
VPRWTDSRVGVDVEAKLQLISILLAAPPLKLDPLSFESHPLLLKEKSVSFSLNVQERSSA